MFQLHGLVVDIFLHALCGRRPRHGLDIPLLEVELSVNAFALLVVMLGRGVDEMLVGRLEELF